ncbi:MAG: hypothetical protein ACKV2T_21000 [Kofleriaceae bacterium]
MGSPSWGASGGTARMWGAVSPRVRAQLPDVERFHVSKAYKRRIIVEAYVRSPVTIPEFTISIGRFTLRVQVNVHVLRDDEGLESVGVIKFTGLHPGAAIAVDVTGGRTRGGICALLAPAGAAAPTHFVTCGHIFPPSGTNTRVIAAAKNGPEVMVGTLVENRLQRAVKRDVSLVKIEAAGAALVGTGGPKLTSWYSKNNVFGRHGYTHKPTTQKPSAITTTGDEMVPTWIQAPMWGGYDLDSVLPTADEVLVRGDSGTILCTQAGIAMGSAVAIDGGESLFEPLGRTLELFTSHGLTLWRNG